MVLSADDIDSLAPKDVILLAHPFGFFELTTFSSFLSS